MTDNILNPETLNSLAEVLASELGSIGWTGLKQVKMGAVIDGQQRVKVPIDSANKTPRLGLCYFTSIDGTQVGTAINVGRVANRFGKRVNIGYPPTDKSTLHFYDMASENEQGYSSEEFAPAPHRDGHSLRNLGHNGESFSGKVGDDPTISDLRQLWNLNVYAWEDLTVYIPEGWLIFDGVKVYWPGDFKDFTADMPVTVSQARYALLEIDSAGTLHSTLGTLHAYSSTGTALHTYVPAFTPGRYVVGAVYLRNGDTELTFAHMWSITSLGTVYQPTTQPTLRVVNNSGAAVAAGDVVLLQPDSTDGFEAVTTTTALDIGLWAVVITGAADGADIDVVRSGTQITVNYTGSAPSIGEYLTTSATAGDAQLQAYVSPAIFAVCTAAGSGGTVEVTLLCKRVRQPIVTDLLMHNCPGGGSTDFLTTINGAPAGAVVTYTVPLTAGDELSIRNSSPAISYTGGLVLHNTTRGTSAIIASVNTAANTITVTVAGDIAAWQNGDTITCRSQTNTNTTGGAYYFDIAVTDEAVVPALAVELELDSTTRDTGGSNYRLVLHPFETYAAAKNKGRFNQVASNNFQVSHPVAFTNRHVTVLWLASGSGTSTPALTYTAAYVAAP